jgi:hypothetical protein
LEAGYPLSVVDWDAVVPDIMSDGTRVARAGTHNTAAAHRVARMLFIGG